MEEQSVIKPEMPLCTAVHMLGDDGETDRGDGEMVGVREQAPRASAGACGGCAQGLKAGG